MWQIKIFSALVACLLIAGCSSQYGARLAHAPEPACGFFQSLAGYRISWASRTPAHLYVSKNWPDHFKPVVEKAAKIWNNANTNSFLTVSFDSATVGLGPAVDGLNGLYWMDSWSESRPTEQGVTSLRFKADHVTEADIRINNKNFTYYDEAVESQGQVHLASLLVHEFGHFLGLDHTMVSLSVMYPYLPSYTVREDLFTSELEALSCEYGGETK